MNPALWTRHADMLRRAPTPRLKLLWRKLTTAPCRRHGRTCLRCRWAAQVVCELRAREE
jgi:hypothetical protein